MDTNRILMPTAAAVALLGWSVPGLAQQPPTATQQPSTATQPSPAASQQTPQSTPQSSIARDQAAAAGMDVTGQGQQRTGQEQPWTGQEQQRTASAQQQQDLMAMCRQLMMERMTSGRVSEGPQAHGAPQMGGMMPRLPPGNEALQMRMHAEMMRQMADVLDKYAGQIRQAQAPSAQGPTQQR